MQLILPELIRADSAGTHAGDQFDMPDPPASPINLIAIFEWFMDRGPLHLLLIPLTGFAIAAVLLGVRWVWENSAAVPGLRWREQRMAENAHEILVRSPRIVQPGDASRLWANLAGLLRRSGWRRLLYGGPHVSLEYRWHARELQIVLWVPGNVPVEDVAAAVRATWRGATTDIRPATAPLPATAPSGRVQASGAWLQPTMSQWFPVASADDQQADPLRALIEAGSRLRPEEYACLQVLAQPASARQSRQVRDGATGRSTAGFGALDGGGVWGFVGREIASIGLMVLDMFVDMLGAMVGGGGSSSRSSTPRTTTASHSGAYTRGTSRFADPIRDRASRQAMEKVAGPQWFVAVQIGVASTGGRAPTSAAEKGRLAGRVRALVAALGVLDPQSVPNRLQARPLAHPSAALAARRMRHGFAASTAELATLAGLILDDIRAGRGMVLIDPKGSRSRPHRMRSRSRTSCRCCRGCGR